MLTLLNCPLQQNTKADLYKALKGCFMSNSEINVFKKKKKSYLRVIGLRPIENHLKKESHKVWWHTPIIPATWVVEVEESQDKEQLGQLSEMLTQNK